MANHFRPTGIFTAFNDISFNSQENQLNESIGSSLPDISQDSDAETQFELELESSEVEDQENNQKEGKKDDEKQEDNSDSNNKENIPPNAHSQVKIENLSRSQCLFFILFQDERTICIICFDEVIEAESYELPCTHLFHDMCISRWLNIRRCCPCCRLAPFFTY